MLDGVRCTSPVNCWAVGYYDKNEAALTQALHWNGGKWSLVATPDPAGTLHGDNNDLFDVACASAVNCWADGDDGHPVAQSDVSQNLVLHWNGKKWSRTDTPNPAGLGPGDANGLAAIRCASPADCWGVGTYGKLADGTSKLFNEVLHWNGRKWLKVTVPSPGKPTTGNTASGLSALSCSSAKSCWAVGADTGTTDVRNQALHWNGRNWRTVHVPNPASGSGILNSLSGLSCTADTNCWAVGLSEHESAGGVTRNEVLHWTGHKWFLVAVPEPAGTAANSDNSLIADRCVSAANCWAVGYTEKFGEPEVNQILHWAGKKWVVAG